MKAWNAPQHLPAVGCRLSAVGPNRSNDQHASYHPDGASLYLQVSGKGARSWIFPYTRQGRARKVELGLLRVVPLYGSE